jgi:hypothetical protein
MKHTLYYCAPYQVVSKSVKCLNISATGLSKYEFRSLSKNILIIIHLGQNQNSTIWGGGPLEKRRLNRNEVKVQNYLWEIGLK